MSKMKHLLRKLHIGAGTIHHHRLNPSYPLPQRLTESPQLSSSDDPSLSSSSTAATQPMARPGAAESTNDSLDFNFFEEEFQVQLALAMSVSDSDSRQEEDSETAQINTAKKISLASSPLETCIDSLSLRYWSYNFVNYDEKVRDGFYDVYSIGSTSGIQWKIPVLLDLQAISNSDNVNYEVTLVNRPVDPLLYQLQEIAHFISLECRTLGKARIMDCLIQKLADLVVNRMGGPVNDPDEILKKWTIRSNQLRTSLKSIVLPLGCIDVGLSRHRALLFKVLADSINLPCMLVKGSHFTGTDEGAVNLVKFNDGSEYIIDLMGAPGMLIPAEVPSTDLQTTRFCIRDAQQYNVTDIEFNGVKETTAMVGKDGSSTLPVKTTLDSLPGGNEVNLGEQNEEETFEHEFGKLVPLSCRSSQAQPNTTEKELDSVAQKMKVSDVSRYVISAAKNPEFAQKLHAVLLESGASPPEDLFSNMNVQDTRKLKTIREIYVSNINTVDEMAFNNKEVVINEDRTVSLVCSDIFAEDLAASRFPSMFDANTKRVFVSNQGTVESDNIHDRNKSLLSNNSSMHREQPCQSFKQTAFDSYKLQPRIDLTGYRGQYVEENIGKVPINTGKEKVYALMSVPTTTVHTDLSAGNDRINTVLGEIGGWEISWEDLQIGERVGIGSYGEVYRSELNGTEVAVKKFMDQDISGDALHQFKCEVEIMLRVRHPNVVLFMGAVTHPPNLSILTEYLPRGSLYKLLHRSSNQLNEKRRLRMALDVAKGMNYLHTSNPVIVHRDLKTPNLLVDNNWVVKVCDFGLSRIKHHTFLSSKSSAGTPEWMAPEVLRNEPSNEKSDVYSFGVILWELATLRVPWTGLNSMQVVGAVGFQNRHLHIMEEIHPLAAKIILDCWHRDPQSRPSFTELIYRLRQLPHLQRK
ncbi:serine/threonine-protein kinase EDR1-like [Impatiens glandulifera]|uniref:serine/threonine-protein kinase EDR1-like n=1 Tax=Impatiens glandulifera TaxID=253017 RepID=UPI001FB07CF8|nr:serine/threonine-protein kinase EDR1-like [Impatiens glandulifera]